MPRLAQHFHYRTVDVSTIKELCRRWFPETYGKAPRKKISHRSGKFICQFLIQLNQSVKHGKKTFLISEL
jgi:oligoribonuclease